MSNSITGATFVPPIGDPLSPIVFVGEQPGRMEVKLRQPFIGPAGRELTDCMNTVGLLRQEAYITNVIKDLDKPLEFHFTYDKGKATVSQSWYKYVEILEHELKQTQGLIIAVGNVALYALCGCTGITKWRGSVMESTLLPGRQVLPIIHPATIIPPKNQFLNRILLQFDLKRAKDIIDGKFQQSQYDIIIRPAFDQCVAYLEECLELGLRGYEIDYDIELRYEQVSCISFAHNPVTAISIPFVCETGDYFTIDQEVAIWRLIARILQDHKIKKRGQNIIFDSAFLLRTMKIITHNVDDTMVAQRTLMPEFPIGLDFITSIWTTHPYYKDEGKKYFSGGNFPRLWNYNGTDACVCAEAFPKQYNELKKQGNLEIYNRQRRLIEPLTFMMERGIKADLEAVKAKALELDKEIEDLSRQLKAMVGYDINPNSPQQLAKFFYGVQGNDPYKKRGTGNVTTDNDAMKRLARKGNKEASMLQKIRKLSKIRSVYLDPEKFDKDNRIRCSYNPVGTRFSRLSSSENIFGTGCLKPEAEVLTPKGWVMLKDFQPGTLAAQWSPDGKITWDIPELVKYKNDLGYMIEANGTLHKNSYTIDHRIPKFTKRGNFHVEYAKDLFMESNWFLPLSGNYVEGKGVQLSTRILAMIQADGSIEGNGIRLSFSKKRKIDRCIALLLAAGIPVTEQSASKEGFRRFYIPVDYAKPYIDFLGREKVLSEKVLNFNPRQMREFLGEASFWDGHHRNRSYMYYTAKKQNAEWLATMAHLVGCSATINYTENNRYEGSYGKEITDLWIVNVKPRDKAYQAAGMYKIEKYDGDVYCLRTLTSFFLCRYQDRICVTGNSNMQNWPHDCLEYLKADDGYLYFGFDLAQAENRLVSYIGRIDSMIEAFEQGKDVHRLTAGLIFGKDPDLISDEKGSCPLGSGEHSERDWGKRANHGLNYDLGYKAFSMYYELPERDSKAIVERYHMVYPGVRNGFHAYVKRSLRETRMLTNLMGRRTLFMGPLNDETFKEAYACIPQGTVGDIINEWAMNYIYYNQQLFKPVELLIQVHDNIGFQIPISIGWERIAGILWKIKASLEQKLHIHDYEFFIPADLVFGLNLMKEKGIELKAKKFPHDIAELSNRLKLGYEELKDREASDGTPRA